MGTGFRYSPLVLSLIVALVGCDGSAEENTSLGTGGDTGADTTIGPDRDRDDHRADVSGEDLRFIMQILEQLSARDFMIAQRTRGGIRRGLARGMAQVDVLALPTMNLVAPAYKPEENRVAILDDHANGEMTPSPSSQT